MFFFVSDLARISEIFCRLQTVCHVCRHVRRRTEGGSAGGGYRLIFPLLIKLDRAIRVFFQLAFRAGCLFIRHQCKLASLDLFPERAFMTFHGIPPRFDGYTQHPCLRPAVSYNLPPLLFLIRERCKEMAGVFRGVGVSVSPHSAFFRFFAGCTGVIHALSFFC